MKEKIGFVEAACQNYKVHVEDKWARKSGGASPSNQNDSQSGSKKNSRGPVGSNEKMKFPSFRLSSEIEKTAEL